MENSSQGLSMLDPDRKVVVTGEEHHQPALARYAPLADGRARRVAVELGFTPAGRIEVLLDGRRVGELTALMSQRYGGQVREVLARRGRPGAVGLVVVGRRGVEMELRLPDVGADRVVDATSPLPPGGPRPTPRGPGAGRPPRGPRSRFRSPLLIGGGVFALLVVVGSVIGGGDDEQDARTLTISAAAPAARPATPTTLITPTPDGPAIAQADVAVSPPEAVPTEDVPAVAVAEPSRPITRASEPPPAPPAPEPPVVQPQVVPPSVETEVEKEQPGGGCDPNYSGACVPIASDVDCEGGSGNGPVYVRGPVQVIGTDIYDLDRDGNGIGCE